MYSLTTHFAKFMSNIQPDGDRVELAQDIPNKLRDYLKETEKIKTVNPHTRLSGSYSRYTAIKEIKDVDILLFVSDYYRDGEECIKEVINDLIKTLQEFPDYLAAETGFVDADLALRRQRRSVQVHLTIDNQEFDIDVVPSIAENGIDEPLLVPDRDLSRWVSSNPLGYSKFLSKLNQEHQNKIVPLIKVFKHWRDVQMKRLRPKSYWLECIVCKYAGLGSLDIEDSSWGELFLSLLNSIWNDFYDDWSNGKTIPAVNDPMLGNNVAKTWTRDEFETFMRRIEESKRLAERALEEKDEQKAIELWQDLFNDNDGTEYFPTLIEESFAKSLTGHSLFVASSGQVFASPSTNEKSWESPQHRNYGDSPE